jgi:hypothetical protein
VESRSRIRAPLLALAGLALLAALWAGLVRLGWRLPALSLGLPAAHGPLIISGFLGTLISLERAVALGRPWAYGAALLSGLGGVALMAGLPGSRELITLGSLGLLAIFVVILRQRLDWAYLTMSLGAGLWLAGNALWWLGWPVHKAILWWAGFLVLTIAGERLELARLVSIGRVARLAFLFSIGLFLLGLIVSLARFDFGVRAGGAGLVALGLWLLRYDLARKTIRQTGLPRFIAACLLPGYIWLAAAGGMWLLWADRFLAGPIYDAMLHSLLLGFVFSMIFGHAPIILPAVTNLPLTYRPAFYLHLLLLHLSLIVRLVGDVALDPSVRMWGGLLNVTALLLFLGNSAASALRGRTEVSSHTP